LFINSIKGVKPGQIVGPIRSGAGLHILKLVERRQGSDENTYVTQTHARHILLRPGGQLSQNAARAKLTDFKLRIERGQADFESLAKEYSQDASASAGGDLGWASTGQFVPEFEAAMAKLSPGQIADPLVTRFGVHLIQVLERKQAALSQKERREAARKVLQDKKFEESYMNWERELRGHAFIEYKESPI
jgi:peptidyl-prolyl cis-trans isomerase SurA